MLIPETSVSDPEIYSVEIILDVCQNLASSLCYHSLFFKEIRAKGEWKQSIIVICLNYHIPLLWNTV